MHDELEVHRPPLITTGEISNSANHYDLNETLLGMQQLRFTGNIVPHVWYKKITFDNGKPDVYGILLLSEIVYWYRPQEIRDERTGALIGIKKKFRADMLQRSIKSFAEQFGLSRRQVSEALKRLVARGLIVKECRDLTTAAGTIGNALFVAPVVSKIAELQSDPLIDSDEEDQSNDVITAESEAADDDSIPLCNQTYKVVHSNVVPYAIERTPLCNQTYKVMHSNVPPYAIERSTYTEITTDTSTKTSTEISQKLTPTEKPPPVENSKAVGCAEPITRLVSCLNSKLEKNNHTRTHEPVTNAVIDTQPSCTAADVSPQLYSPPPAACIDQNRIADKLSSSQKARVKQEVDRLASQRRVSNPNQIFLEIEFALLDPKTLNRSHYSFNRKLGAILHLIKKNQWRTPSGMQHDFSHHSDKENNTVSLTDPNKKALREIESEIDERFSEISHGEYLLNLLAAREDPVFDDDKAMWKENIKRLETEIDGLREKRKLLLDKMQKSDVDPPQALSA